MQVFAGVAFLVWVVVLGVPLSMAVLAWCAYYRVKGIERALWAVVTQLQHLRQENSSGDAVQRVLRQPEPLPAPGKIANSMFGR